MKKYLVLTLSLFIALLILIFIILPLSFGALARHYINNGLKNWGNNHPGATYEFKTISRGVLSSTEEVNFSFGGISVFHSPIKLLYGPFIFDDGLHFGLARIGKNISNIEGLPPTSYSGKISFLGNLTLNTHTPNPASLINLASLMLGIPSPIGLNSIDTEIQSNLVSRSLEVQIFFNQLNLQKKNLVLNLNQLEFSLNNFTEIHGDPSAKISFQAQGLDYQDGFNHLIIPSFAFNNYQATGSRFEAIDQLSQKISQANSDPELIKQAVELIFLGFNSDTEISLTLKNTTPLGMASFDAKATFPKLPSAPTPLEIIKHAKYQIDLTIPAIHYPASKTQPTDLKISQLSIQEDEINSTLNLGGFSFKQEDQTLFKLNALSIKSSLSNDFFSREDSWTADINLQHACLVGGCVNNLKLANEIKGLDKNALLDSQGDLLVNAVGALIFENTSQQLDLFPLKSLLTKDSEDTLNITANFPHGESSLDLNISTPNFNPKQSFSKNLVASGVLKIPSEDLSTILSSNTSPPTTDVVNPAQYDILDTSNLNPYQLINLIRHSWINAGYIAQENQNGTPIETLIFNFTPKDGLELNHKDFDELHQAALYANMGDLEGAINLLNKPRYQENPIAQKMKDQISEIQKSLALRTTITNTPDADDSNSAPANTPLPLASSAAKSAS